MISFSFGRNWKRFVRHVVNDEILQCAQDSLRNFLGNDLGFEDKVFLDIGCGSGLFSLAALRLGACHIISIDIDKHSIEATQMLQEKFYYLIPQEICWEVLEGNILDKDFVDSLCAKLQEIGKDIVLYSWGVLHHTGNLSLAMNNVMRLASYKYTVDDGGGQIIFILLYTTRLKQVHGGIM